MAPGRWTLDNRQKENSRLEDRYVQATRQFHTRAAWRAVDCSGRRPSRAHLAYIMQGSSIGRPGIVAFDRGKARAHTGGRAASGEDVRSPRQPRRVHALRLRWTLGSGSRDWRAFDAASPHDRGLHTRTLAGLRLRRRLVRRGAERADDWWRP